MKAGAIHFYSSELKLQVVEACAQPGASIAGIAMQNGINTPSYRSSSHLMMVENSICTLSPVSKVDTKSYEFSALKPEKSVLLFVNRWRCTGDQDLQGDAKFRYESSCGVPLGEFRSYLMINSSIR